MVNWPFFVTMALASLFVVLAGNREMKFAILTLDLAFTGTLIFYKLGSGNWLRWPVEILVIDIAALVILTFIALRSNKFWPLPVAALHIIPVITPLVDILGKNLMSNALGVTQGVWGYVQLLIVVAATMRNQQANKTRIAMKASSEISSTP